jgi:uncharacterized membrane-anchored protein
MRGPARWAIIAVFLMASPLFAQVPQTDEERSSALRSLPWRHGGEFHLAESKITLTIDRRFLAVTGLDAERFYEASQGKKTSEHFESVVLDPASREFIMFARVTEGHVRFNDWNDVDADRMLEGIKQNTARANKERLANNSSPVEVVGWREKPTLDHTTQTVSWTIEAKSQDGAVVNAIVLTFGRFGYEKLTWVGPADHDPTSFLNIMRGSTAFDVGARYADFRGGDKIAQYGVASSLPVWWARRSRRRLACSFSSRNCGSPWSPRVRAWPRLSHEQ